MRTALSLLSLAVLAACGDIGLSGTGPIDLSSTPENASEKAPPSSRPPSTREASSRGPAVEDGGAADSGPDADGGKGGKKAPKPTIAAEGDDRD
jgi:hypothetical protein